MMLVGSDDGVYRVTGLDDGRTTDATKTLESGRVMRLRQFDGLEGVFAATQTGLYRSVDGDRWMELGVPREKVYAVGASRSGKRLYAGTRPAHVYVAETAAIETMEEAIDDETVAPDLEWHEQEGFQELPSRGEWRLPRHDDLAQVRDLHADPGAPNRITTGVEVGGVHVSDDGGGTWEERSDGVHDDVHELHVVGPDEYVAATGDGLYRTTDAGRTWERLDRAVPQSYFRRAFSIGGVVYASGALSNSSTWEDDDADPALFAYRTESLEPLELPRAAGTVTGMTAGDGALVVATHRGRVFARSGDDWTEAGEFPVPGPLTGRYTPLTSTER